MGILLFTHVRIPALHDLQEPGEVYKAVIRKSLALHPSSVSASRELVKNQPSGKRIKDKPKKVVATKRPKEVPVIKSPATSTVQTSARAIVATPSPSFERTKEFLQPAAVAASAGDHGRSVHTFYYAWYGSPDFDGQWIHWNHQYLPHWNPTIAKKYRQDSHNPDKHDIGTNYWPSLGPYSSANPKVIEQHFAWMQEAGIDVAVVSWYPSGLADDNGKGISSHKLVLKLLDAAASVGTVKICLHIEPYQGRNANTLRKDLAFIHKEYGRHSALYRRTAPPWRKNAAIILPVVYVYDSYHTSVEEWATILTPNGPNSIRGVDGLDCHCLFLWVEQDHGKYLSAGFDGFYTYFAATRFVFGSTPQNWKTMAAAAASHGVWFVPSVGPGYIDVRVRPWNAQTQRPRAAGKYYDNMFEAAINQNPQMVSVTSFNEWHEGTQIEPSVPMKDAQGWSYLDFSAEGSPNWYLQRTKHWADKLKHL